MTRVVVTGGSGFLGRYVTEALKDRYTVLGTYRHQTQLQNTSEFIRLDLTEVERVHEAFTTFHPDVVVHTAALSDVDACERQPDAAHRVNVQGTEAVARAAVAVGARLIAISTDQVYDGVKGHYNEADVPRPLMVYGRSKLEGERRAAAICPQTVILRLALMYGWGSASRLNFVDWLVQRLREGEEVPLFTDQYRTPLYVVQAAEVIRRLIDAVEVHGTFNLGGGERINRYAFGLTLCEVFDLSTALLKPIVMDSTTGLAARPRDCSMNSARISGLLQTAPLTVEEGLRALRRQNGE